MPMSPLCKESVFLKYLIVSEYEQRTVRKFKFVNFQKEICVKKKIKMKEKDKARETPYECIRQYHCS